MTVRWTLGGDAADPQALARFWCAALGYVIEPGFDGDDCASIVDPDLKLPTIGWLQVPEGKRAKNRIHIDIRVSGEPPWNPTTREHAIRSKVAELVALGATRVRDEQYEDGFGHVVMLDPEGNEFCVA